MWAWAYIWIVLSDVECSVSKCRFTYSYISYILYIYTSEQMREYVLVALVCVLERQMDGHEVHLGLTSFLLDSQLILLLALFSFLVLLLWCLHTFSFSPSPLCVAAASHLTVLLPRIIIVIIIIILFDKLWPVRTMLRRWGSPIVYTQCKHWYLTSYTILYVYMYTLHTKDGRR